MLTRLAAAAVSAAGLIVATVGSSLAATPEVITWSNDIDAPYIDCGSFEAHGVWTVDHRLTIFFDGDGTPIRDIEVVDFEGAFVNPDTGASIPDSGRSVFFDTLAPDYSFLTTMQNAVRHSHFMHSAGRTDWQTGTFRGHDAGEAGAAAVCAALGA